MLQKVGMIGRLIEVEEISVCDAVKLILRIYNEPEKAIGVIRELMDVFNCNLITSDHIGCQCFRTLAVAIPIIIGCSDLPVFQLIYISTKYRLI